VRSQKRTTVAFIASAVVHVAALSALMLIPRGPPRVLARPISMRTISAKQWAQNRGRSAPVDQQAPLHPRGQVVDVAPGNNQIPPESKYLAETNNRVDKQTRAREQSQKWSIAQPKNTPKPEQMPTERGRAGGKASAVSAASRLDQFDGLLGARPRLSQLLQQTAMGAHETPDPSNHDSNDKGGTASSQGDEARGVDSPTAATGGAAPNDNLQDVPAGDGTFLNTREWRYAGFFNRVKQAVSAHWDPQTQIKKKGGYVSERTTQVVVTLRPDGSLADVFVSKGCGMDALDREAMAAFEKAAPFPNPPRELVENGFIRFQFGFSIVNEQLSVPRMLGLGH
jgi:TonB family protein